MEQQAKCQGKTLTRWNYGKQIRMIDKIRQNDWKLSYRGKLKATRF
jgi:hypothetical protein